MKKFICISIMFGLLFTLIFISYSFSDIKTVHSGYLKQTEYSEKLNVSGEFESRDKTYISLSYPVYIKDVFVKPNSYVNKGQALFSIDKEKMFSVLNGSYPEDMYEKINYDSINSISSVNSIDTAALYNMPETVYSSSDGIITQLNVYPGAIVMANQHLVVLTQSDSIMARFTLSQIDYGKIRIGDNVNITPLAFQNSTYTGVISSENAVVKKQNSAVGSKVVVDVFATVDNPDSKVADGLQINGTVSIGQPVIIQTLDYKFINQDKQGQYVFVYENGKAVKKYIETGIETDKYTEIRTVFPQDTVFITCDNLADGDRVILGN